MLINTLSPKYTQTNKWTEIIYKYCFKVALFQNNSQLSSCILHLCVSIGNKVRSSGQDRVTDNLKEDEENIVVSLFFKFPDLFALCVCNCCYTIGNS